LLEFYLDKWFGEYASFLLGLLYILIVLFLPFGIVGTWKARSLRIKEGWERLLRLFNRK
jgi:ABC-type branched-subunit amino acid transport system permease subunit